MRLRFVVPTLAVILMGLVTFAAGQERRPEGRGPGGPPGGGGGMTFGGGFMSRLFLLRVPEIQKELELVDEQVTAIQKVQEELGRGGGGPPGGGPEGQKGRGRGRPEGKSGNEASLSRPVPASWYFVQAQNPPGQQPEGRRGFGSGGGQPPSEEDRARFEQMRLDRARQEKAKLSEILLPHQMKRLTEIYIQQAGVAALDDEDVSKELNITAEQKAAMGKVRDENRRASMEQFQQGGGGGGDPDAIRAKAAEMRKAGEEKVFALLTSEQKAKFEELKGKQFDLPENAIRNIFAGRGGPGGRGPGGPGENRGKRPDSN